MEYKINRIYNMDCVEGMKGMPASCVDKILTSPPYNIIRPNSTDRGYDLYKDGMSNEEYSEWICNIFNEFDRIGKRYCTPITEKSKEIAYDKMIEDWNRRTDDEKIC
jgi:DNA modification methylase